MSMLLLLLTVPALRGNGSGVSGSFHQLHVNVIYHRCAHTHTHARLHSALFFTTTRIQKQVICALVCDCFTLVRRWLSFEMRRGAIRVQWTGKYKEIFHRSCQRAHEFTNKKISHPHFLIRLLFVYISGCSNFHNFSRIFLCIENCKVISKHVSFYYGWLFECCMTADARLLLLLTLCSFARPLCRYDSTGLQLKTTQKL